MSPLLSINCLMLVVVIIAVLLTILAIYPIKKISEIIRYLFEPAVDCGTQNRTDKERPSLNQYQVGWDKKKDLPLIIRAECFDDAYNQFTSCGNKGKPEPLECEWLEHAHDVLDEVFPLADEEEKDAFASSDWQNARSDFDNCRDFEASMKP